jgi:hypothetical protein
MKIPIDLDRILKAKTDIIQVSGQIERYIDSFKK